MKKFLVYSIYVMIFSVILLWVSHFLYANEVSNNDIDAQFESYIDDVILRNAKLPELNTHTIIFIKEDFLDMQTFPNDGNSEAHPSTSSYQQTQIDISPAEQTPEQILEQETSVTQWYFGTPRLPWEYVYQENCSGLIFQPCLQLWKFQRATWGMNFWSDRTYN